MNVEFEPFKFFPEVRCMALSCVMESGIIKRPPVATKREIHTGVLLCTLDARKAEAKNEGFIGIRHDRIKEVKRRGAEVACPLYQSEFCPCTSLDSCVIRKDVNDDFKIQED